MWDPADENANVLEFAHFSKKQSKNGQSRRRPEGSEYLKGKGIWKILGV